MDKSNAKNKKYLPLTLKIIDTGEIFHLKEVTTAMTIREVKGYLELVTGIPANLQRLHYLDEAELQDHTDIKGHDIVSGGQLHMTVWHTWIKLIKAVVQNNVNEVIEMGVTQNSTYSTPNSDYMNSKNRQEWLRERAAVALFIASHRGHNKLVKALVDAGTDVRAKTKHKRTALHVSAAQGRGTIVDILLKNGADVNEVDDFGETALSIAEKFGHKDGARQLFLYRWQVRALKAEKVPKVPLYYHQQCDTANPVWISGTQGQLYYTNPSKYVGEYSGTSLHAGKATQRKAEIPADLRIEKKISHEEWLSEVRQKEEAKMEVLKAERAAKKLEEDKKREQTLIDKESFDTWVKRQQEQKEKQMLQKKLREAKYAAMSKETLNKGGNTARTSDTYESETDGEFRLNDLIDHFKTSHRDQASYDSFIFQNGYETFERVKHNQMKHASEKRNPGYMQTY